MQTTLEDLQTNLRFYREDLELVTTKNKALTKEAFNDSTDWIRTGKLKAAIHINNKEIDRLNRRIRDAEIKINKIHT